MGFVITCLHKIKKHPYACIFYSTLLIALPVTSVMQIVPNSLLSLPFSQFYFHGHTQDFYFMVSYKYIYKKDLLDEKCTAVAFGKSIVV